MKLERPRVCPDCPAKHTGVFAGIVEQPSGCAFRCLSLAARQPLPDGWRGEYSVALVRRGIVVRQRVDTHGRATAIDIAGSGSALPIASREDDGSGGYAVDDAMLCLCPSSVLTAAVDGGHEGARGAVAASAAVLARVERISEARSRPTASSRVGTLLVTIADTLSAGRRLETIPAAIQQRDLAALLALRHESVCRVVASFTRRGVLKKTTQGLEIVDRDALEAA
jgi:hypothetical protein